MAIETPKAIIFVDGEEFMRVWDDSYSDMYDETKKRVREMEPTTQHEYALMVYKPRYGVFMRERLDWCV